MEFQTASTVAPWTFRVLKSMVRRRIRGSSWLTEQLRGSGWFDRPVLFPLTSKVAIEVPIGRRDSFWDERDLQDYDALLFETLPGLINQLQAPVMMVDGGADIGLFSLKVVATCPQVRCLRAFEPNPVSYQSLSRNLARLNIDAVAVNSAISDFNGKGAMKTPNYDSSDHARFLAADPAGGIPVTTVDDLKIDPALHVVIKLDLEGGEMAALRGAERTIRQAPKLVVILEAHPKVFERTGIDPCEMFRCLAALRPFRFLGGERSDRPVDISRPFFDQFEREIVNVTGVTL